MITSYADDTDFIDTNESNNKTAHVLLPSILQNYNLKMNTDKTEFITISRDTNKTMKVKKFGSKLNRNDDLQHRIQEAAVAFRNLWKLWHQKKKI